jgi:AcrR family transcriptional regulator
MSAKSAKQPPSGPRAERKREAIVHAARTAFLRDGFDASMDLIAAEAGVSKVTVYNHFGSKQTLFVEVVKDSLDAPLGDSLGNAVTGLVESDDLREAFIAAARTWVDSVRSDADVLAMRNLVARELHRFPELGHAWLDHTPEGHHPVAAAALAQLNASGRLVIPDLAVAIIQLYSLLVYPHMVFSSYGAELDEDLAERLISGGVDMFLGHYGP